MGSLFVSSSSSSMRGHTFSVILRYEFPLFKRIYANGYTLQCTYYALYVLMYLCVCVCSSFSPEKDEFVLPIDLIEFLLPSLVSYSSSPLQHTPPVLF